MLNDHELIQKIKEGDQKSFRELYDRYGNYGLRVAAIVTKNNTVAADVVQETFVRVYRNIKNFDANRPFKPWFYKILINECNRTMKKNSGIVYINDYFVHNLDPAYEHDHDFEQYEDLHMAIRQLKKMYRIPIVLKYLNELTDKEIATILDLNVNTIKSRLFKAKKYLKDALKNKKEGDMVNG